MPPSPERDAAGRARSRAARRDLAWAALAALLVPALGLALLALVPATPPDAAYAARVQAWRDIPSAPKPGQPAAR